MKTFNSKLLPGRNDEYAAVFAYFTYISDTQFLEMMRFVIDGIGGYGGDGHVGFELSEELEPGEEPFEGVKFHIFHEENVISYELFHQILTNIAENYVKEYPNEQQEVTSLLQKIAEKFQISST